MTKQVYIVVHPDAYYYGDRHIEAVFSNEGGAKEFIEQHKDAKSLEIDEHDLL
jgi:hypothetical protein